ncbi:hypothetical protein [Sinorhizobium fredii]|uniref:hypothetical protein n=1 Tax=Rhizobium fredii TaxID=380 RepID=UPI0004B958B0|nr:hypothetical protein [Sinorhizobium fredii]UTY48458.1 hypothetical protein EPK84_17600 [Sinorhizobium fredii]
MARFLASYDLTRTDPSPHSAYLKAAEEKGWSTWIESSDGAWYRLPNTTIVATFDNIEEAAKSFHSIKPAAEAEFGRKVTVEKYIVVHYSTGKFNSNENTKD